MDYETAILLQAIARWIAIGSVIVVAVFVLLHLYILYSAGKRAQNIAYTEEGLRLEQLRKSSASDGKKKQRRFKGKSRHSKRG